MQYWVWIGLAGLLLAIGSSGYVAWHHRRPTTWGDLEHGHRRTVVAELLAILGATLQGFALVLSATAS